MSRPTPEPVPVSPLTSAPEPQRAPEPESAPVSAPAPSTTASGLTVRRRGTRPAAESRPGPEPVVEPGRPAVAAAWMAGSRSSRENQNTPRTDEGR